MNPLTKYRIEVASLMTTSRKLLEETEGEWSLTEAQREELTFILAKLKFHLKEAFLALLDIEDGKEP